MTICIKFFISNNTLLKKKMVAITELYLCIYLFKNDNRHIKK